MTSATWDFYFRYCFVKIFFAKTVMRLFYTHPWIDICVKRNSQLNWWGFLKTKIVFCLEINLQSYEYGILARFVDFLSIAQNFNGLCSITIFYFKCVAICRSQLCWNKSVIYCSCTWSYLLYHIYSLKIICFLVKLICAHNSVQVAI